METLSIQNTAGGTPLPWQSELTPLTMDDRRWKKNEVEKLQLCNKPHLNLSREGALSEKLQPCNDYQLLALRAYEELLRLRNYSYHTLKTYRNWFLYFLNYFPGRKPSGISKNEIMDFLVHFKNNKNWSATSQNQLINSIKFFYEKLLNRSAEEYNLPRAQKPLNQFAPKKPLHPSRKKRSTHMRSRVPAEERPF